MKIYDTAQKQLVEFQPLNEGLVKMYVCGATVQDSPHIGHLRAAVAFDVFHRYLLAQGYRLEYVRNVTDIDDKVLQKAEQFDQQWFARAYYYEREFTAAYDLLNVLPPTYEPRATGQIPEMVEFIERLLSRGHAYKATDGIYFDVKSWPKYGELTHQTSEDALLSDRDLAEGKVDPRDFALWKFAKPTEPATAIWEAPFGKGRPGWHIECSTMCLRYLGESFDIHGGGLDLRFPHHENETAQSHAAGYGFANHWMHSAWVTLAGEKMSKSIGNVLGVQAVLQKLTPLELRFALASTHYRKNIEWSEDSIHQAQTAVKVFTDFLQKSVVSSQRTENREQRIENSLGFRIKDQGSSNDNLHSATCHLLPAVSGLPAKVVDALNDDLNTSEILEWLFKTVRSSEPVTEQIVSQVRATLNILGCDPLDPHWSMGDSNSDREQKLQQTIRELVGPKLLNREQARRDKDFETADAIRLELEQLGLKLVDSPSGTEIEFES